MLAKCGIAMPKGSQRCLLTPALSKRVNCSTSAGRSVAEPTAVSATVQVRSPATVKNRLLTRLGEFDDKQALTIRPVKWGGNLDIGKVMIRTDLTITSG